MSPSNLHPAATPLPPNFPPSLTQLRAENDASVKEILAVIESDGWEYVTTKSNVVVVRKFMPPPAKVRGREFHSGKRAGLFPFGLLLLLLFCYYLFICLFIFGERQGNYLEFV